MTTDELIELLDEIANRYHIKDIVGALKEYYKISISKHWGKSRPTLQVGNFYLSIHIVYPVTLAIPFSAELYAAPKVEHPPSSSCDISASIHIYKESRRAEDKKKRLQSMQWIDITQKLEFFPVNRSKDIYASLYREWKADPGIEIFPVNQTKDIYAALYREWKADHGIEFSSTLMENIAKDLIAASEVIMGNHNIKVVLSSIKE